jgi:hypothetical protein
VPAESLICTSVIVCGLTSHPALILIIKIYKCSKITEPIWQKKKKKKKKKKKPKGMQCKSLFGVGH